MRLLSPRGYLPRPIWRSLDKVKVSLGGGVTLISGDWILSLAAEFSSLTAPVEFELHELRFGVKLDAFGDIEGLSPSRSPLLELAARFELD